VKKIEAEHQTALEDLRRYQDYLHYFANVLCNYVKCPLRKNHFKQQQSKTKIILVQGVCQQKAEIIRFLQVVGFRSDL